MKTGARRPREAGGAATASKRRRSAAGGTSARVEPGDAGTGAAASEGRRGAAGGTIRPGRFVGSRRRLGPRVVGAERGWSGPFTFVQLADTQFGLATSMASAIADGKLGMGMTPETREMVDQAIAAAKEKLRRNGAGGGGSAPGSELDYAQALSFLYERELDFSRRAVASINAMSPPPRFVVVCGDLVNQYPKTQDGPVGQRRQVADFKEIFSHVREDIRLLCLCGNHDIGDRPNSASIAQFRERFGDDYFTFMFGGVQFVAINSQLYKDATDAAAEATAQDKWLRGVTSTLKSRRRQEAAKEEQRSSSDVLEQTLDDPSPPPQHVVAFSHIPPFIESQDEPSAYFNLEQGVRARLLKDLYEAGCSAWFCGHYHRNAGGFYTPLDGARDDDRLEVVVSSAIGTTLTTSENGAGDPLGLSGMGKMLLDASTSGLRVVRVGRDRITHDWTTLDSADSD